MLLQSDSTYCYELAARFEDVSGLRHWFRTLAQRHAVALPAADDVEIALAEACNNIIEHAYRGSTDGQMRVELSVSHGKIKIVVFDEAPFFAWGQIEQASDHSASDPALADRHRGRALMELLLDHVEARPREGCGTELIMQKYWKPTHENQ